MASGDSGTHYPDIPPLPFGNMKEIKRLPQMRRIAPKIRWGDMYRGKEFDGDKGRFWNDRDRLRFAERLACSMNHAADVLQTERNNLLEIMVHQEKQLKENAKAYVGQGDLMHAELGSADAEKQKLYRQIVALTKQVKGQAKRIKELEG